SPVRQHGQVGAWCSATGSAQVMPPSAEARIHTAEDPPTLESQAARIEPSLSASSEWKLCEPNTSPVLTLTGSLQLTPPSSLRACRRALSGNRLPTSRPTV